MDSERTEILRALTEQRRLLRIAVRGVSDEDAARRTTVSELTLGGLVRHLTTGERNWIAVLLDGNGHTPDTMFDVSQYAMQEDDTLTALLDDYARAAAATDEVVRTHPDLDQMIRLPESPWAPGVVDHWPARRILLHLLRETAHHSGHADLIRESLDGANTTAQLGDD